MSKWFGARSVLWPMVVVLLTSAAWCTLVYVRLHHEARQVALPLAYGLLLVAAIFFGAFWRSRRIHNLRHPKQQISAWQLVPIEIRNDDEGLRSITASATQWVYTYSMAALMVMITGAYLFDFDSFTTAVVASVGLQGMYVVYLIKMRGIETD